MSLSLSALSALFSIIASFIYIQGILAGKTKPVKASSIIGKLFTITTFIGMWQKDTVNGQISMSLLSVFITTPLTLYYGKPGWSKIDVLCFTVGICGLFLWVYIPDPTVGIGVGLLVLFMGSIPTWFSAWEDPRRENKYSLLVGMCASLSALFAAPHISIAYSAQPLTFLAMQCIMGYLLWIRPFYLECKQSPP
ncbi:hypothetical protein HY413_00330 [Candidatus Kaiserbacteria bacterium]|nr:hypothetical protein [Candidatus Kaiserbacteria bacterium]